MYVTEQYIVIKLLRSMLKQVVWLSIGLTTCFFIDAFTLLRMIPKRKTMNFIFTIEYALNNNNYDINNNNNFQMQCYRTGKVL